MPNVTARLERIFNALSQKHDERLTGINAGLPTELLEYWHELGRLHSVLRTSESHKLINSAEALHLYAEFFRAVENTVINHGERGLFIGTVAMNLLQCLKLHDLIDELGNYIPARDSKRQLRIIGENSCHTQKKMPAVKQAS